MDIWSTETTLTADHDAGMGCDTGMKRQAKHFEKPRNARADQRLALTTHRSDVMLGLSAKVSQRAIERAIASGIRHYDSDGKLLATPREIVRVLKRGRPVTQKGVIKRG